MMRMLDAVKGDPGPDNKRPFAVVCCGYIIVINKVILTSTTHHLGTAPTQEVALARLPLPAVTSSLPRFESLPWSDRRVHKLAYQFAGRWP